MKPIAYYVSGHGYGHAVRSAEIIRAFVDAHPDSFVHVRTSAPAMLFEHLPSRNVQLHTVETDAGVVEQDGSLRINREKSIARLEEFIEASGPLIKDEAEFVRRENIGLLVADIPFSAGFVAAETGVPCVAISNFTWDWIYEPLLANGKSGGGPLPAIRAGYASMRSFLRLPFGHATSLFDEVIDVPLVATGTAKSERAILAALDIRHDDPRRRVLVARRGGFSQAAIRTAAAAGRDFMFLFMRGVEGELPDNVRLIADAPGVTFEDALSVSGTVISKFGYGTVAACVAAGTNILYPPRDGFREDEILGPQAERFLNTRELALDDYERGNWTDGLSALHKMPPANAEMDLNGAQVCARQFVQHLENA